MGYIIEDEINDWYTTYGKLGKVVGERRKEGSRNEKSKNAIRFANDCMKLSKVIKEDFILGALKFSALEKIKCYRRHPTRRIHVKRSGRKPVFDVVSIHIPVAKYHQDDK